MMKILIFLLLLSSLSLQVYAGGLDLRELKNNAGLEFKKHIATKPDSFGNALALNVQYGPIKELREIIEKKIKRKLKFLTAWDPAGEAHVTTITPPEYVFTLRHHITMKRIHEIAHDHHIQKADLKILGIGSGAKVINKKKEETFFVIVDSDKLRHIRYKIYEEFVANGGSPDKFDPSWFFPHITIGYTAKDLHENNGVLKDIKHSLDRRFGDVDLLKSN